MEERFNVWMPVSKSADGRLVAILSDTSLDRDDEFMTKELIMKWAKNKTLKALANHENKMQSWVGGWSNLKVIEKGENTALVADPWFFSAEANPLAAQIKKQVEEALAKGEAPGISIGALPLGQVTKEIEGRILRGYSDAELLEATWVPIQSNRNATFGHLAKQFDLESHENKVEEIQVQKSTEEIKMTEEVITESPLETQVQKEIEQVVQKEVEEVKKEENNEVQKLIEENKVLKEKLDTLEKQSILKATVENPALTLEIVKEMDMTIENMLRKKAGLI